LFLLAHAPDVVMLSEYREGRGDQLRAMLVDAGLVHALTPDAPTHKNRVAIISRWALLPRYQHSWHERLLAASIPALDLDLVAAHIPDESAETRRASAWQGLAGLAKVLAPGRAIIAGDFNTARSGVDAPRPGQTCERWMGALATFGFRDCVVESARAAGITPLPTWFGPQGEAHRIDGIWASSSLFRACESASQDDSCVAAKLSDHALVVARFAVQIGASDGPAAPAGGLFS
jgi:exonuclease III